MSANADNRLRENGAKVGGLDLSSALSAADSRLAIAFNRVRYSLCASDLLNRNLQSRTQTWEEKLRLDMSLRLVSTPVLCTAGPFLVKQSPHAGAGGTCPSPEGSPPCQLSISLHPCQGPEAWLKHCANTAVVSFRHGKSAAWHLHHTDVPAPCILITALQHATFWMGQTLREEVRGKLTIEGTRWCFYSSLCGFVV